MKASKGGTMKTILLIGSSQYRDKFQKAKDDLEKLGHKVLIPAFDDTPWLDSLGICDRNLELMKEADEVHVIWDNRSVGTIFDLGMAMALKKKVVVRYIEPKTFEQVINQYESRCMYWESM